MITDLAAIHKAAFAEAGWWPAETIAGLLEQTGVDVLHTNHAFVLLRIVEDEAEILSLAVHPDAQQQGLGGELVTSAKTLARSKQVKNMFLEVATDNIPALRLYQRHGFVETGRRKKYYQRNDGTWSDAVLMQASLTERQTPQ